jgi:predicted nucleic acid-binding protein
LHNPPRKVLDLPVSAYPKVGEILARYADLDPDFTDAAIVWLAEKCGCRAILTVDVRDFSVFRLQKGRRFELLKWSDD